MPKIAKCISVLRHHHIWILDSVVKFAPEIWGYIDGNLLDDGFQI